MKKLLSNKKLGIILSTGIAILIFAIIVTIVALNNKNETNKAHAKETETETETDEEVLAGEEFQEETTANTPLVSSPYLVKVNRALNCVTVYAKDESSEYTVPVKALACSTGREGHATPLGTFSTSGKSLWCYMVDGTYSQYAYRIHNGIMFHSVPCFTKNYDALEFIEFNKLGSAASLGCVRLNVIDAKWIYENCPSGTTVIIYDDYSSPGPLGKPDTIIIPDGHPLASWDPTDPNQSNPWHTYNVYIESADSITLPVGSSTNDLLNQIKVYDTLFNDLKSKTSIEGTIDLNTPNTYNVTIKLNWLPTISKSINIVVQSPEETSTSPSDSEPTT